MRAAIISAFGDLEGISVDTIAAPERAEGMALIKVEASTIGFADTLTRRGLYPPGLTHAGIVSGGEAVGRVVSVGASGPHELVGRRVYAIAGLGCHAEFVNAPLESVIPVPEEVDPKIPAAFGVNAIVAHVALERADVGPETTVLVRGGAGSLGSAAVRLAKLAGAQVIATASSDDRAAHLKELGAALVLDREGRSAEGKQPACDVVVDPVAGSAVPEFLSMLNPRGRYVLLGAAGGPPSGDFAGVMLANFFKSWSFSVLSLHAIPTAERTAAFTRILAAHAAGALEADIDSVVSLDQIKDAHRRIEACDNLGKIIVAP